MIHDFVDRRGGGLLFLGGRDSLADGGYAQIAAQRSAAGDAAGSAKNTFRARSGTLRNVPRGADRGRPRQPDHAPGRRSAKERRALEEAAVPDEFPGSPVSPSRARSCWWTRCRSTADRFPLLITQNFGRGRTAVFATGGSWRWQMLLPVADKSHEMFYTQLLRWLVNDTPRRVIASTPQQVSGGRVAREAARRSARSSTYLPAGDATVEAHILGRKASPKPSRCGRMPLEQGSLYGRLHDAQAGIVSGRSDRQTRQPKSWAATC